MDNETAELSELAGTIAVEAADLLQTALDRPREDVTTKSSSSDFVTDVDRACEDLIVKLILAARPDDAILGEEGGSVEGTSGYRWVIDPIDGTSNFIHRHTGFAVSIAVEREGESLVGVVFDVMQRELFHAVRGSGATRNGKPIRVSQITGLPASLVATGFSYNPELRGRQGELVAKLLPQIADIRRMGAAAVDLCSVACGRVDAYFERGLNPWDYAAGALIAAEAGARVGAIEGGSAVPGSMIAASPEIFEKLRRLVQDPAADG